MSALLDGPEVVLARRSLALLRNRRATTRRRRRLLRIVGQFFLAAGADDDVLLVLELSIPREALAGRGWDLERGLGAQADRIVPEDLSPHGSTVVTVIRGHRVHTNKLGTQVAG